MSGNLGAATTCVVVFIWKKHHAHVSVCAARNYFSVYKCTCKFKYVHTFAFLYVYTADLLNRLSDILNEKLTTAIANCAGYALDELSGGNSGGGSSSGMNRSTHGSNSGGISYNNDSRSNDSNKNDKNRDKDIVLPIFASSSSSSSISSFSRREFEHTSYNDDRGIKNCDGDRSDDDGNKENDGDINNLLGITTFSSKGEGDDGDIHAALMSFAQDDSDDEIDDPARILYNMSKNDVGNDKEGANMPSGMSIGGDGGRANHNTTGVSASATQSESGGTLYQSLDVDYLPILTGINCATNWSLHVYIHACL